MTEEKKKPGRPAGSKNKTTSSKSKSTAKSKEAQLKREKNKRIKDEIWSIVMIAIGAFLVVALQTKAAGQLGVGIKTLLMGTFGTIAFILPYYLFVYGFLLFTKRTVHIGSRSILLVLLIFGMMTLLNSSRFLADDSTALSFSYLIKMFDAGVIKESGGAFGMFFGLILVKIIGMTGLYLFSIVTIIISVMLVINTPLSQFIDQAKEHRDMKKREMLEEEEYEDVLEIEEERISNSQIKEKKSNAKNKSDQIPLVIPESTGISNGQMKILDYMKDDGLFEKNNETSTPEVSMGLDDISTVTSGLGLEQEAQLITPELGIESGAHNNVIVDHKVGEPIPVWEHAEALETEGEKDTIESIKNHFPLETKEPKAEVKKITNTEAATATLRPEEINLNGTTPKKYQFPSLDLLNNGPKENKLGENETLKAKAMKLEQTLHDFNVNAKVIQVTKGPAVTRYEIQPNTGVKVSSIVRLADDIALNLEAKSIRLEAPIPGKAAVGIEVENDRVNMVSIREILESPEFKSAKSRISFAVGKDIAGNAIVGDLKGMPHMLIAGSTGSGKSVCINSIITSLLYKATPDEVKLVLIDPKVVELANYNGIPHLLIPVVTEPSKAAAALNWAVAEMTDRYKKFAEEGVRDLESFNRHVKEKNEHDRFLPQIVIIIDELADLMMAAPSQVEESICRLAQMARAAGMHLIVATQRPSVDVITGVIKANIPSRIAFAVSSQVDSRTILDMGGAEKLVGKGDMLFNPLGMAKPIRVQGTFISDTEVHNVIEFVKSQVEQAEYASDVIHSIEKVQAAPNDADSDELLSEAIETVVKAKQASVSMLQRRFRIGYNRAARLVDMMEARGIVGPADGSRPRQVFLTEEELTNMDEELKNEEL